MATLEINQVNLLGNPIFISTRVVASFAVSESMSYFHCGCTFHVIDADLDEGKAGNGSEGRVNGLHNSVKQPHKK